MGCPINFKGRKATNMTFKAPVDWSGETWRWIAALFVAIVSGAVSATWAGATYKLGTDREIERVRDSLAGVKGELQQTGVALLKELDSQVARQELRNEGVNRRLAELESQAKINAAVLSTLKSLETEVRYLSNGLTELKQEIRDRRN